MFDEFFRELRRMPKQYEVPIDLPLDEKGYLDRQCPHRECGSFFKVVFDDWKTKVSDQAAFCPKCGHKAAAQSSNTRGQEKYIKEVGEAYLAKQLNTSIARAARRTRRRTIGGGLFNITMDLSYKPSPPRRVGVISSNEALRQDFACEDCQCRYSSIGAAYFCPACRHNSALTDFDQTVSTTLKAVAGLDAVKQALVEQFNDDDAANIEQQMLEDQIENLVTALQRVTEALFERLPNASSFTWDQNRFQRIDDASALWKQATGNGYDAILIPAELKHLKTMVQRRHKIGHKQGMLDQRYINQSGDSSYQPGQRLVTKRRDIVDLAELVTKLVDGLR